MADLVPVQGDPFQQDPMSAALSAEDISGDKAEFIKSIYHQESGGGKNTKTSNAGAVGGMQIIPATFNSVKDEGWDIKDPYHNVRAGVRYASQLYDKAGGNAEVAAAGYYGGEGAMAKAKEGVAVKDPRNPKAPDTLQYGKQVASRMGKPAPAPTAQLKPVEGDPFEKASLKPVEGDPFETKKQDSSLVGKAKGAYQTVGKNIGAAADVIASYPGAIVGTIANATSRITDDILAGKEMGDKAEEISKTGHETGQKFSETTTKILTYPVHKILNVLGIEEDYSDSGVARAMNKVGEVVNKGADWLADNSKGQLSRTDAEDIVNAATLLLPGKVASVTKDLLKGKAGGLLKEAKPAEEASLREVSEPTKTPFTPQDLAKRNIEETTGINATKERTGAYKEQARQDARAAFTDDHLYEQYLRTTANLETTTDVKSPEAMSKVTYVDKQKGSVDPKLLAKMAAVGIGIGAGAYLDPDDPFHGMVLGGLAGLGTNILASKVGNLKSSATTVRDYFNPSKQVSISDFGDHWEHSIKQSARAVMQEQNKVFEKAPDEVSRTKITNWMQGDKSIPLTDKEYAAARDARNFFNDIGKAGLESGVLKSLIPDYVTNLWDLEGTNKKTWDSVTRNMSPNSKFNLQRKISSIAEGKKLGLKPLTEDITTIMGIYGNSLSRTMANRQLVETLKKPDQAGKALVMSTDAAPKEYVPFDHPNLQNLRVHPDIAPSLKFIYSKSNPQGIMKGMEALNTAVKRSDVSLSLFHGKALADAFIGAGGNPIKIIGMVGNTNKYLKMIREGGAGDLVDKAIEGGLVFTIDKGKLPVEDVSNSFYEGMHSLEGTLNDALPGAGKLVKGYENVNHAVDEIMWNRLHAGMKLEIFAKSYETLKLNNAEAGLKDPSIKIKTDHEIAKIAADYTNSIFGGLNWRMIAENTKTQFTKDLAMNVLNPTSRRGLQLAMFAPDWTISTTRSALNAFGEGSVKGLIKPKTLADLHRQYLIRSALYYFTVGNALNYALSGHGILDNKDPTQLELGDGRTMQFSKHMMEPVHWVTKPKQQLLNKLGIIPSEMAEQAQGKEYLSASGTAPDIKEGGIGRVEHFLKKMVPISFQSKSLGGSVSSALGFPIGGYTEEEKQQMKAERRAKYAENRKKKKRKEDN